MIKSIEIWNFESHEHTFMESLSSGFNLIFGESNAGKTSIIRALKLIAYNEFDPKSVRVGQKECSVEVVTERGRVKVTKPSNTWEIEPKGGKSETYEKIGKVILPEAVEIIGLSMVQLGDLEMPVNVMNQLEGHFMLSELNGKSASGSIRAQIIDEISGLSGIEGIIKEVSLDNHRWGRDVKQMEDRIKEIDDEKHDEEVLDSEQTILDAANIQLKIKSECDRKAGEMESLCAEVITEGEKIEGIESDMAKLPDTDGVDELLNEAQGNFQGALDRTTHHKECIAASEKVKVIQDELARMPDVDGVDELLNEAQGNFKSASARELLHGEYAAASVRAKSIKGELALEVDAKGAEKCLDEANEVLIRVPDMVSLIAERDGLHRKADTARRGLKSCQGELADAELEMTQAMASIKVCPLTQLSVGPGGCGNGAEPVAEEPEPVEIVEKEIIETTEPDEEDDWPF